MKMLTSAAAATSAQAGPQRMAKRGRVPPAPPLPAFAVREQTSPRVFTTARDDPKYTRFFKMVQVGVPLPAVKILMSVEGIDGSVLDDTVEA